MRKKLAKVLSLITLFSLVLAGCKGTQATATPEPSTNEVFNPVVSATGVVVPAQWATLAMPAGGLLLEVSVREGDTVTAGQVLARLDGQEAARARLAAAENELASAQQALAELTDSAPGQAAQAEQDIVIAQTAVIKAERDLVRFDQQAYKDELDRARDETVKGQNDLKTAQDDFKPYESMDVDNATRKSYKDKLDEAQRKYDEAARKEEELKLQKDQSQAALAVAQAQLAEAQKRYENHKDGPDPLEMAAFQTRIDAAQAGIASEQAAVDKLELKAPFAGVVADLKIHQGEWVNPGTPVLLLADLAALQVETTDLNEIDAARVNLDDKVTITFDALPGAELNGRVVRVAPKSDEGSGVNYTVVIELASMQEGLRWGMTAFVDIEVGK